MWTDLPRRGPIGGRPRVWAGVGSESVGGGQRVWVGCWLRISLSDGRGALRAVRPRREGPLATHAARVRPPSWGFLRVSGWAAKTVKRPPVRHPLGAANAQTTSAATSTAPAHQRLGSANVATTPAGAPAAAADKMQRPDARKCDGQTPSASPYPDPGGPGEGGGG